MKREEILEVYKVECSRNEKTRNIQWRFNIALWTLLALAILYFKGKELDNIQHLVLVVLSILFICAHFLFIYLTQRALEAYRRMADAALDALDRSEKDFIEFSIRYIKNIRLRKWAKWWIVFQVGITVILVIIFLM